MEQEKLMCEILEVKYTKLMQKRIKNANVNSIDFFPLNWHSSNNYKHKLDTLVEAIEKNIPITETLGYLQFIEGVKFNCK